MVPPVGHLVCFDLMQEQVACTHCGQWIDADARFCRHCGSSDEDGWRDDDAELLGDDDFDYDEFVRENFSRAVTRTQTRPLWRIVAVVLLVLAAFSLLVL